jgi:hypothetical protein
MNLQTLAFGAIVLVIVGMTAGIVGIVVYEYRHPCLRYSTHRVFVPELTTYIVIDAEKGLMMPQTTPAHDEDETVCEERK